VPLLLPGANQALPLWSVLAFLLRAKGSGDNLDSCVYALSRARASRRGALTGERQEYPLTSPGSKDSVSDGCRLNGAGEMEAAMACASMVAAIADTDKAGTESGRGEEQGTGGSSRGGSRECAQLDAGGRTKGKHTRFCEAESSVCAPQSHFSMARVDVSDSPHFVWDNFVYRPRVPMHLRSWIPCVASPPPPHRLMDFARACVQESFACACVEDSSFFDRPSHTQHTHTHSADAPVLRILSYNLLAESLEHNTTKGLARAIASFEARKWLLADELAAWDADICCLQEVSLLPKARAALTHVPLSKDVSDMARFDGRGVDMCGRGGRRAGRPLLGRAGTNDEDERLPRAVPAAPWRPA
jgi:hypothetical protein